MTIKVSMVTVSQRREGEQQMCVWGGPSKDTGHVLFLVIVAYVFTFSLIGTYTSYVLFWRHVLFLSNKK